MSDDKEYKEINSAINSSTPNGSNKIDGYKLIVLISSIVTIFAFIINFIPYYESNGGKFIAKINGKEVTSPVYRTYLVYMNKDSVDISRFGFFPQITNPSKFKLKDVLLKYTIYSDSTSFSISDYYKVHAFQQNIEVTYEDDLHNKNTMPRLFRYFVMKDNGQATIEMQATYKGVKEPFLYKSTIYTKKLVEKDVIKRQNIIYDDVKRFFYINNIDTIDLYYIHDVEGDFTYENCADNIVCRGTSYDGIPVREFAIKDNQTVINIGPTIEKDSNSMTHDEKEGTPWYMYIVGIILGIVYLVGTFILIFRIELFDIEAVLTYKFEILWKNGMSIIGYRRSSTINPISLFIEIIVSVLLLYVIQFTYYIIIFGESEFSWPTLALSYSFFLGLFLIILICKKVHKINSFFEKHPLRKPIVYAFFESLLFYIIYYILH